MKKLIVGSLIVMCSFGALANADELTGDTKLACEAILCLSTSTRPSECSPSIARYFGIKDPKKWSKTLDMRRDFLALCPYDDGKSVNVEMEKLIDDIHFIKSECTAAEFNKITEQTSRGSRDDIEFFFRTTMTPPDYCVNLANNAYTDVKLPTYTCNGNFYKQRDWQNGYVSQYNLRGDEIGRTLIQKDCWVD